MAIDRDKLLQNAGKLVDKKKYDKAVVEYRKIVQHDPHDARTLLKIGDLQSRQGDYAGAVATYDRVATFYSTQGFQLKAIAVFKQIREMIRKHAPELGPRYSHITPRLADIYAELNLVSDALTAYDEVATMYQKAGRDRDAIVVFEKTVQLDPKNPLPHLRLAEARCRIKQLDEAIASFWTAAELLLGLKRPDDALKVIERILQFKPDAQYARAAAQLYLRKGDAQAGMQALSRLQIAFQADPKNLDTLALLAQAFEVINQAEKALEVHLEMGRLARDQGRRDLWEQILAHLAQVAPTNAQVIALRKAGPPFGSKAPPRSASTAPKMETAVATVDLDEEIEYIEESEPPPPAKLSPSVPPAPLSTGLATRSSLPLSRPPSVTNASFRVSRPEDLLDFDEGEDDDNGVPISDLSTIDAQELRAPQSFQPSSHAHKALANAELFRSAGLLDKAVEVLHIALELDPNSVPIRQKLREILIDANEREGAIQETLNIAIIHIHNQNPDEAESLALEVLSVEPNHPEALNILDHVAVLRENASARNDEGHLASFDMEGVRPSAAINDFPEVTPSSVEDFDDLQFMDEGAAFSSRRSDASGALGALGAAPNFPSPRSRDSSSLLAPPRPSPEAIEEVLEEAEFFASQGLYSDAEAILADMLENAPDHVLLREQLNEIHATIHGREREELPPETLDPNDNSFDIAASLDALDDIDGPAAAPEMAARGEEVDVDQVFAKFKEGVKAVVKDTDSATHYDLGLAYKEMGLLEDACSEFELASNDLDRTAMCCAMVGLIRREQGNLVEAKAALFRGLEAKQRTPAQEKGIEYDLALIFQQEGDHARYVQYLRSIAKRDQNYRDVSARIRALGESLPESDSDDDEFDAAFDNLF